MRSGTLSGSISSASASHVAQYPNHNNAGLSPRERRDPVVASTRCEAQSPPPAGLPGCRPTTPRWSTTCKLRFDCPAQRCGSAANVTAVAMKQRASAQRSRVRFDPRRAGPVKSPRRCPYDHQRRSVAAVASVASSGADAVTSAWWPLRPNMGSPLSIVAAGRFWRGYFVYWV